MRKTLALLIGLLVLGLLTFFLMSTKQAGVEFVPVNDSADPNTTLPISITVSSDGEIRLDGRVVDSAALGDEVAQLIAAAVGASLPEPSFIVVAGEGVDNLEILRITEALAQSGATSVSLEFAPVE